MARCSVFVSEAHPIRLAHLFDPVARGPHIARRPAGAIRSRRSGRLCALPAAERSGRKKDEHGGPFHQGADCPWRFRSMSRCLARQPRCSLRGRFPDGGHQVEVSDLARRLVRKSAQLRPDAAVCSAPIYSVRYKLSHADSRLPKEVTDYVRTEFSDRGPSGRDLGEARGASPSTHSARTLITAWIDDRRSRGRARGAPENHVARGT
jgi:hypothetical protein